MAGAPRPSGDEASAAHVLSPAAAAGFQSADARLRPVFAASAGGVEKAARVALPGRGGSPFEVTDLESGLSAQVTLAGASDVEAEIVGGYAVYRDRIGEADVIHRPTRVGTEDFVVFARAPSQPVVYYEIALGTAVAGLRLVSDTLEFLDASGTPRLRVAPPCVIDSAGTQHAAELYVEGCAVDTSGSPPWGRAVTPPGSSHCGIRVGWSDDGIVYPAVLDPSWTTTGNMTSVRLWSFTATELVDGRVLVAGGFIPVEPYSSNTAEIYDPASGTWGATGNMMNIRQEHAAVVLPDGRAMVIGGFNQSSGALSTTEIFSPSTGTWTFARSLPQSRRGHTATTLSTGRVLVAFGGTGSVFRERNETYEPTTNEWIPGDTALGRNFHTAELLADGAVLIAGGVRSAPVLAGSIYLPLNGLWSQGGAFVTPRYRHASVRLQDGRVMLVGGLDGAAAPAGAEIFDPATQEWTTTSPMATFRDGPSATLLLDGRVLVAGGAASGVGVIADAEIYDPSEDTWTPTVPMASTRGFHRAIALNNGRVLVIGGDAAGATSELFDISGLAGTPCSNGGGCSSNSCVDGVCCETACGDGATDDCQACSVAAGAATNGTCGAVSALSAILCRPAGGECDVAETCDGVSAECPDDVVVGDGSACNDASACTEGDRCDAGSCTPGFPVDCTLTSACQVGSCDATDGCIVTNVDDGADCDDGDACTAGDACEDGACGAGPAVECDDGDACTADGCLSSVGCVSLPLDGTPCGVTGTCIDGACNEAEGPGGGGAGGDENAGGQAGGTPASTGGGGPGAGGSGGDEGAGGEGVSASSAAGGGAGGGPTPGDGGGSSTAVTTSGGVGGSRDGAGGTAGPSTTVTSGQGTGGDDGAEPASDSGCSCNASPPGGGGTSALVSAALAVAAARRRRTTAGR